MFPNTGEIIRKTRSTNMNTQNLSDDIQTKSRFFSGKSGRNLVIILCSVASIAVFAVFIWLYPSPQILPAPVATEPAPEMPPVDEGTAVE